MIEFRALEPGEEEACLELWSSVFGVERKFFERYFWGDPDWTPRYTRVCRENGKLVAAVQIVRRALRLNGHTVPMAGIANVATLPECRRKGYATRLMEEAIHVMEHEDFLFSLLFTGIHDFYARLGWHRMTSGVWQGTPQARNLPDWRFRSAGEEDLDLIMAWYEAFNARHPLTVVRSESYWRGWIRWYDPGWRQGLYVGEHRGEPKGYVWVSQKEKKDKKGKIVGVEAVCVLEVGCEGGDMASLVALLQFVSDSAFRLGADYWIVQLPLNGYDGVVAQVMENPRWVKHGSAMVRPCGRNRLWHAFSLLSDDPLSAQAVPEDPVLALRLLFGAYRGRLKGVSKPLQDLFPPRPTLYWQRDGF